MSAASSLVSALMWVRVHGDIAKKTCSTWVQELFLYYTATCPGLPKTIMLILSGSEATLPSKHMYGWNKFQSAFTVWYGNNVVKSVSHGTDDMYFEAQNMLKYLVSSFVFCTLAVNYWFQMFCNSQLVMVDMHFSHHDIDNVACILIDLRLNLVRASIPTESAPTV